MNDESYSNDELAKEDDTSTECTLNDEDIIEEVQDILSLMGIFIREKSQEGQLTNAEDFLDEPFSLEVDNVFQKIDELKYKEEFSDICVNKGKEKIYLYSRNFITDKYAEMVILVEEKDLLKTIAKTVRNESKIYPRPTDVRLFSKAPFKISKEEFYEVYEQLKKNSDYKDIQEIRASNNAFYLYSDMYLKKTHAASLAEWIEVESQQNP